MNSMTMEEEEKWFFENENTTGSILRNTRLRETNRATIKRMMESQERAMAESLRKSYRVNVLDAKTFPVGTKKPSLRISTSLRRNSEKRFTRTATNCAKPTSKELYNSSFVRRSTPSRTGITTSLKRSMRASLKWSHRRCLLSCMLRCIAAMCLAKSLEASRSLKVVS